MGTILSIVIGVGLSAACGFRVFIPPLVISLAAMSGHLQLAHGFEWMGTVPALIAFAVASGLEITAYYVPWLDNLLDSVATPAAVVAGIVVTASMVTDFSPMLKWTLAIIAGGGAAGLVQGATVITRAASTVATGGAGNSVLATAELGGSLLTAVLAVFLPLLALALVGVAGGLAVWKLGSRTVPPKIVPS